MDRHSQGIIVSGQALLTDKQGFQLIIQISNPLFPDNSVIFHPGLVTRLHQLHTVNRQQIGSQQIPLDRILLETDSPYLTPVPFRGKRNESSYIPHIAGRLAELCGLSQEEVARTTTENAQKLFAI
mgnify:CR=1 FL=1